MGGKGNKAVMAPSKMYESLPQGNCYTIYFCNLFLFFVKLCMHSWTTIEVKLKQFPIKKSFALDFMNSFSEPFVPKCCCKTRVLLLEL